MPRLASASIPVSGLAWGLVHLHRHRLEVTEMADQPASRDPVVERAEVVKVLQRVGMDDQDIATALSGVGFPDRVSHIAPQLMHLGITRDRLIDQMGGSP
jgi:hypothetical protein